MHNVSIVRSSPFRVLAALALLAIAPAAAQTPTGPVISVQGPAAFVLLPGQAATLSVLVASRSGAPQANVAVTFVAPQNGPSGTFVSASATTNGSGIATASFTAGSQPGPFLVAAYARGVRSSVTFAFTVFANAPPASALTAANARAGVASQILRNAIQDESLQLHGPFLLPAGTEVRPALGGNPHLYTSSIPVKTPSWLFWIDDAPLAGFSHNTRFVIVDAAAANATQAADSADVFNALSWPAVLLPGDQTLYSLARPVPVGRASASSALPNFSPAPPRFADPPPDACAIVVIGPNLPGAADDAKNFKDYLTRNSLVSPSNIIGKLDKDGEPQTVSKSELEGYVKDAAKKGCKTVYIMFSAHGGAIDSPIPGLEVNPEPNTTSTGFILYSDLHNIYEPLKGAELHFYQNSCYSGLVAAWLQGWGFKGDIVTTADGVHTSYTQVGVGSFFFSQQFLPLLEAGQKPADAIKTLLDEPTSPKEATAPKPQFIILNPNGPRQIEIPTVVFKDVQLTQDVKIIRPKGLVGPITITLKPAGQIGTFDQPTVTMTGDSVAFKATSVADGSTFWMVTAVDANGQTYEGTAVFQVGAFRFAQPTLTVAVTKTADQTVTRYGPNIDRGDVLNLTVDTSDTYTVKSADTKIAEPSQATIQVPKGQTSFTITAKGNAVGSTTFTVTNKRGFKRTFKVDVVANTSSSGISCPDSGEFDMIALILANLGNHPIRPSNGRWMFASMGSGFSLRGPDNIMVTGTIDSNCRFSGSGPYTIFGFSTRVDVTDGRFVMPATPQPPGTARTVNNFARAASSFGGMQFNYAIGNDGKLPTGQPITFSAQGSLICSYTVQPSPLNFTAGGGTGSFSVTTDPACPWTPASTVPWITLGARTPAGSTKGAGIISFTVAPNSGAARSGSVTIAATSAGSVSQDAGGANRPVINTAGVVNGASFRGAFTSGAWVTIQGRNLAANTRIWQGPDFINGLLPTSLDGVSVTINGKAAFVYFISPSQLNILAPAETADGALAVQVSNAAGKSDLFLTTRYPLDPALFLFDPQNRLFPAAVHADGAYVGPGTLFGGAVAERAALPGDAILLFGTGFGDTNPVTPFDRLAPVAPVRGTVVVRIGGVNAPVAFAGLISPGLYQINIAVPNVPPGNQALEVFVDGVPVQDQVYLSIGAR